VFFALGVVALAVVLRSGTVRLRCVLMVLIPLDVAHDSGMISPTIPG
jgi:hypothetical protein